MISLMHTTTVMRVSRNGQVSIPAAARARWVRTAVLVVDVGDHIVMRPWHDDTDSLIGKYAGRGPDTDAMRRAARRQDRDDERRTR